MCVETAIQNATIQSVAILAPEIANKLAEILKSRFSKSNSNVLDCFLALTI